eukprot:SAG11_NODE_16010_length_559_cov_1.341304_1_plen_78_part_10
MVGVGDFDINPESGEPTRRLSDSFLDPSEMQDEELQQEEELEKSNGVAAAKSFSTFEVEDSPNSSSGQSGKDSKGRGS